MTTVIALTEQIKAVHPETGKPVTVVGIEASDASFDLKLVILHRGPQGIFAESVDYVDEVKPTAKEAT